MYLLIGVRFGYEMPFQNSYVKGLVSSAAMFRAGAIER
jgi:hypothetical protein